MADQIIEENQPSIKDEFIEVLDKWLNHD